MNEADSLKIVKWILIVLVAGFIGQFGKMLASHLIDRAKRRRNKQSGSDQANRRKKVSAEDLSRKTGDELKAEAKARKKDLKNAVKIKKNEIKEREKNES